MKLEGGISGLLFGRLGLKAAALLCSLGLWAFLASQDLAERTLGVPFSLREDVLHQPDGTVVIPAGRIPLSVAVRIKARRHRLRGLDERAFHVRLELKGAPTGKPISAALVVERPFGFAVVDIEPVAIKVRLEPLMPAEGGR